MNHHETQESARVIRAERAALRNSQQDDPLAKRMRTVKFWRDCLKTNPGYCEPQSRALYRNPGFRRYLMPGLAAMLTKRERSEREAWLAELRAHSAARQQRKAMAANPLPLFPEEA